MVKVAVDVVVPATVVIGWQLFVSLFKVLSRVWGVLVVMVCGGWVGSGAHGREHDMVILGKTVK